jgi:hypothetical protein
LKDCHTSQVVLTNDLMVAMLLLLTVLLLVRARCRFGPVTEVRIVTDRETNMCKGYAFIGFATREIATAALNGEEMMACFACVAWCMAGFLSSDAAHLNLPGACEAEAVQCSVLRCLCCT